MPALPLHRKASTLLYAHYVRLGGSFKYVAPHAGFRVILRFFRVFLVCGPPKGGRKMDNRKEKTETLVREVILNDKAQQERIDGADPDFLNALEFFIKHYDSGKSRNEWFRIGVIIGGVYERG